MKDINKLRLIGKVISAPVIYDGAFSETMQEDVYFKSIMKVVDKTGEVFLSVIYPKSLFDFMQNAYISNDDIFSHGFLTSCHDNEHFNMMVMLNKAEFCKYAFNESRTNTFVVTGRLIKSPKLFVLPRRNVYGLLIQSHNADGGHENIHGSFQTPNGVEPLLKEGDEVACKGYLFEKIGKSFRSFSQQIDEYDPAQTFLRPKFLYALLKSDMTYKSNLELSHFDSENRQIKKIFYNLYDNNAELNKN